MQGFTYHQDICEDWKMTADCDVCATVISWTPDCGSPSSNILNSNNKPIKDNFQLLPLPPVIQRTPFNSLGNHISEWKRDFCWEQVLKGMWRQRTQSRQHLIRSRNFPRACTATWEVNTRCQSYLAKHLGSILLSYLGQMSTHMDTAHAPYLVGVGRLSSCKDLM